MGREKRVLSPYDVLMPDIIVYQTVEDYKNGADTVMEEIRRERRKT